MFNAKGEANRFITPHETYNRLGLSNKSRLNAYASLFDNLIDNADIQIIRNAVRFSMPTGDSHFKQQIERTLNRKIGYSHRGRPEKSDTTG